MSEGHDSLSTNLVTYLTMMHRAGTQKRGSIKYAGKFKIKTRNSRTDGKF